jgi:hypothetical protein
MPTPDLSSWRAVASLSRHDEADATFTRGQKQATNTGAAIAAA